MEDGLCKSGLRIDIGFLSLLMLLGISSSYARSSFKNTPLYRHVVRRRNSEPVRLYEKKPIDSSEEEEAVGKSSNEEIKVDENKKYVTEIKDSRPAKPTRIPVARLRPANLTDPSTFTPEMPFSEAIGILRNSTFPKLNIVVLWKDLEENADIYADTPIGIDGVSGVSLNRHLRSLVDGVSGGAPERLGYVVEDGVVVIATLGSLPHRMVTRVYDITDLVGQPSTGFSPMGMMGMGMPGMGMGMMGGGMMGGMPYGGAMGGMMGGGMMGGGMMGGMMPGMGGGYGNFGGGYSNVGGGYGTNMGFGGVPYR